MPNTREKEKLIEVLSKHIPYGYGTMCLIAEELISNGVTVQQWISVKDRLPEEKQLVLAVCKSGKIFVGYYWNCHGTIIWAIKTARDSTKNITQIVTHWMPLPEPPKGE